MDEHLEQTEQLDESEMIDKLLEYGYVIPRWCTMAVIEHCDGVGGCWGISGGYVKQEGEDYCKACEYYNGD